MVEANGWGTFPAVVAYYDGSTYWLGDGFHRVQAARDAFNEAANLSIPCEVRSGTRRDAILHAAGANASHGLRRTNADKQRAVETLLRDNEWAAWSNSGIARRCAVDEKTVRNMRSRLEATSELPKSDTRKGADGRTYNTVSIGKSKPDAPAKVEAWQLERVVSEIPNVKASTLRTAARERKGHWLFDTAVSRAEVKYPGAWSQTRLVQAIQNVAEQMEQRERQAATVSPEQRQYESAVAPIAVPQPPAAIPAPDIYANKAANAGEDMPFTDPLLVPQDLLDRGWVLKRVGGVGRFYCHNTDGPRATGVFDTIKEALAAAREMQVDLRNQAQPVVDMAARERQAREAAGQQFIAAAAALEDAYNYLDGFDEGLCEMITMALAGIQKLSEELNA